MRIVSLLLAGTVLLGNGCAQQTPEPTRAEAKQGPFVHGFPNKLEFAAEWNRIAIAEDLKIARWRDDGGGVFSAPVLDGLIEIKFFEEFGAIAVDLRSEENDGGYRRFLLEQALISLFLEKATHIAIDDAHGAKAGKPIRKGPIVFLRLQTSNVFLVAKADSPLALEQMETLVDQPARSTASLPHADVPASIGAHDDVDIAVANTGAEIESGNDAVDAAADPVSTSGDDAIDVNREAGVGLSQEDVEVAEVSQERLLNPPRYPIAEARNGIGGIVVVRVKVDSAGNVLNVGVHQSSRNRNIDRAALDAARRWKFSPGIRNGQNVGGEVMVPITFTPPTQG